MWAREDIGFGYIRAVALLLINGEYSKKNEWTLLYYTPFGTAVISCILIALVWLSLGRFQSKSRYASYDGRLAGAIIVRYLDTSVSFNRTISIAFHSGSRTASRTPCQILIWTTATDVPVPRPINILQMAATPTFSPGMSISGRTTMATSHLIIYTKRDSRTSNVMQE